MLTLIVKVSVMSYNTTQSATNRNLVLKMKMNCHSQPDVNMLFRIQLFGLPVIIRYAGRGNTIGCLGYGPPYNIGKHQFETLLGKNMRL